MMSSWDPLIEQSDADILAEAKKRQIKNILKSYVGVYDPFSELIQNSMDAVDLRKIKLQEEDIGSFFRCSVIVFKAPISVRYVITFPYRI